MDRSVDAEGDAARDDASGGRKPWSTPRVILSEVRSTLHQVGVTPFDKTTFAADHLTVSGSQGS
jgi:hypothetical protein